MNAAFYGLTAAALWVLAYGGFIEGPATWLFAIFGGVFMGAALASVWDV